MDKERLSKKKYWDSLYESLLYEQKSESISEIKKISLSLKKMGRILAQNMGCLSPYSEYLLLDVICKKYLPKTKNLKILEVGSAPGYRLLKLSKTFGFIPYGVEYSKSGVEINRKLFSLNGINPENVIYADFFAEDFHNKYKGYFDIVISRGFIEHFDCVDEVIKKHIDLLKNGGYLIVSIPNLRGGKLFFFMDV